MVFALVIIIAVCLFLVIRPRKSKGWIGERHVAHILARLPKEKYRVINDLLLRTSSGGTTQIDHVVISEYGIFVIETKFYDGRIYGGENSDLWTQNIYGNIYQFRNPILQNAGHIKALRHLLEDYGDIPFIPIVAFSRQAELRISVVSRVIYWNQVRNVIKLFDEKCISHASVVGIYNQLLESNLSESKEIRKEHISNIRSYERNRNIALASGKCPRCGGRLILRHGKFGSFYGCSNYPRCKFIEKEQASQYRQ